MTDKAKFPMFVVFDLDGTLALNGHRQHFLTRDYASKDWRGFYAACGADLSHFPIIATLFALESAGHDIEIWSGRSDEVANETSQWLHDRGLGSIPLKMRSAKDHQPDTALKLSWLDEASRKPDLIFDDRASVVAMWREQGIVCCQVAPGDF